uniref:Uncharacterized protein n=1 Tax=Picea glauca TaxID=3330 RepID=A0A101LVU8_PICGL|nr:hypothetical protein ABT39_MTgene1781 [Picea glauca]
MGSPLVELTEFLCLPQLNYFRTLSLFLFFIGIGETREHFSFGGQSSCLINELKRRDLNTCVSYAFRFSFQKASFTKCLPPRSQRRDYPHFTRARVPRDLTRRRHCRHK